MIRFFTVISVALLASTGAVAEDGARANLNPVAQCFDVRGRMSLTNGTPSLRIWVIGTKRILGVDGGEDSVVPQEVRELLTSFQTDLFGDFTVCPLSRQKPGEMQRVYVKAARNLVSRKRQ